MIASLSAIYINLHIIQGAQTGQKEFGLFANMVPLNPLVKIWLWFFFGVYPILRQSHVTMCFLFTFEFPLDPIQVH